MAEVMMLENGNAREDFGECLIGHFDEGSTESHRYYLARRTTLEMLKDRGYSIPPSEIDLPLSEFRAIHGQSPDVDRLRFSATHTSDPSKRVTYSILTCILKVPAFRVYKSNSSCSSNSLQILVIFCGPHIVKVTSVRNIAGQIVNRETLTGLVLIVQSTITSQALKAVNLFSFKVEIFQITDLLVNITKHVLKPKHEVLTDKQKKNLLRKYNLEEKQLPRILLTDAIARYYGLEKGQVVKITYSGDITQLHVTYRCVW